jgi:putative salt-induced outer membrane protein
MRNFLFLVLLGASGLASAEGGWKGTGELGLALTRGNSETESLNAKLGFVFEDDQWKHELGAAALRQKGEVVGTDDLQLTANRYEVSASSAWKFSERTYMIGALRYENDDFAPYEYQGIASIGIGWYAIKSDTTQFLLEGGPGYRTFKEVVSGDSDGEVVFRGRVLYSHAFNEQTSFENILLVEAGSTNTFAQNDTGLVVKMTDKLALKAGLQFRHNSDVAPGLESTDSLFTTNLVYSF